MLFAKLFILDVYGSCECRSGIKSRYIYLWETLYCHRHHWRHQSEEAITSLLFIDFGKAVVSMQRENIKEILLVYGILEETTKTIKTLYTNAKVQVKIIDEDKNYFDLTFFNITAGILQVDTLAPYLPIFWLYYTLDQSSEIGLIVVEKRSRKRLARKHLDADYGDDKLSA